MRRRHYTTEILNTGSWRKVLILKVKRVVILQFMNHAIEHIFSLKFHDCDFA